MTAPRTILPHIRALDGFRALAILSVLCFHWGGVLLAGWIGVQLFFVLSGFLITSILLADRDRPFGVYLERFYWRRTLRIFPLYYGFLALLTIGFLLGALPTFGLHWKYLYSYTLNFDPLFSGTRVFFDHLWSLAVEEQFYLVWPALMYVLPRRWLPAFILSLIVGSPALRWAAGALAGGAAPNIAYRFTFCQLDAFAAGAAVVLFRNRLAPYAFRMLLVCSVAVLVAGQLNAFVFTGLPAIDSSLGFHYLVREHRQYVWSYTMIDLWAAAALVVACGSNIVAGQLARPALVWIGRISYGMYVLHPIVQRTIVTLLGGRRAGITGFIQFAVYLAVLLTICSAIYVWYEAPFLRLKDRNVPPLQPVGAT